MESHGKQLVDARLAARDACSGSGLSPATFSLMRALAAACPPRAGTAVPPRLHVGARGAVHDQRVFRDAGAVGGVGWHG